MKVGIGYDMHQLVANCDFVIGGIKIDYHLGILGHSDGDVLTHAIINALLGAMGLGDIGQYFPSSDPKLKNISSLILLDQINDLLNKNAYQIINIDTIIICQKPKLSPYYKAIKKNLANTLKIDPKLINIKSTTTDNMGEIGANQAIASQAIALISKI